MSRWAPADVLLVVEVSGETVDYDLGGKAIRYARAGFAHYRVVTRDGVHAHSGPLSTGYVNKIVRRLGEQIDVPYADGVTVDVGVLIDV